VARIVLETTETIARCPGEALPNEGKRMPSVLNFGGSDICNRRQNMMLQTSDRGAYPGSYISRVLAQAIHFGIPSVQIACHRYSVDINDFVTETLIYAPLITLASSPIDRLRPIGMAFNGPSLCSEDESHAEDSIMVHPHESSKIPQAMNGFDNFQACHHQAGSRQ
jgi:hypothetical protein